MGQQTFAPEHQLILSAARVNADAKARASLADLARGALDWSVVARTAMQHGVAPLVLHTLTTTGAVSSTDARISSLRDRSFVNAGNSLVLSQELVAVFARLGEAGVPAISYKGPGLAASLYGDLALREFTDLDVLVKPRDVPKAREILIACGYEPQFSLTPAREQLLLKSPAEYCLRFDRPRRAGRVALELHWRIPSTFPFDDAFWDRIRPIRILGADIPHFAPEDLLLILCVHGFKHAWSQLKWLCDVREVLGRSPKLDWDLAMGEAKRLGGLRMLLVGCALARNLLDANLPPGVSAALVADPVVVSMADAFGRRYDRPSTHVGLIDNLRIRERLQDRIQYGLSLMARFTVPPLSERVTWPAWPGAGIAYGLAHPFRIAARTTRKKWL